MNDDQRLDPASLRLAFIVYGAMSRKDWRTISLEDVFFTANELKQKLFPLLRQNLVPTGGGLSEYGRTLVEKCREKLSIVYPLSVNEMKFLNLILDKGEIDGSVLTNDKQMQERINRHPMLHWKALHVRKNPGSFM